MSQAIHFSLTTRRIFEARSPRTNWGMGTTRIAHGCDTFMPFSVHTQESDLCENCGEEYSNHIG